MKCFPLSFTVVLAATGVTGCRVTDRLFDPYPDFKAAGPNTMVPPDFLFTRYTPVNTWLDTPMRVQILDLPLLEVFDHPALRGFRYEIVRPPRTNPRISIDKLALTRRQLLWSLSQDHQLHMTPHFGPSGELYHIDIISRASSLEDYTGIGEK